MDMQAELMVAYKNLTKEADRIKQILFSSYLLTWQDKAKAGFRIDASR